VDLTNLPIWQYGLVVGGALLVVGLLLYFLGVRKVKVPPVVPAGFGGVAAGLAAGVIWLGGFGYKPVGTEDDDPPAEGAAKGGGAAPKMGMPKGGPPKGGLGGGAGPPAGPRVQLINLVNALDVLVDQPVSVTLTAEERAAVAAQLRGLDTAAEIKEDEAKARLDAILKVVARDRKALEAIGYRWPGPAAPKSVTDAPTSVEVMLAAANPFHEPRTKAKVNSLQQRLTR
jgi:hypothetical protein